MSSEQDLTLVLRMRDEATKVLASFEREMRETGAVTKTMATNLRTTNSAMRDADAITKRLSGSTREAKGEMKGMLDSIKGLAGGGFLLYGLKKQVEGTMKEFISMQDGMSEVRKTSGLMGKDLLGAGDGINKIAQNVPLAQEKLYELAATAGRAGVTGKDAILEFTKTTAQMSIALDGIDTESLLIMMNNTKDAKEEFGGIAGNIKKVAAALNALDDSSATSAARISMIATDVAAAGSNFNLASEDVLAWSTVLAESGVDAGVASTTILKMGGVIQDAGARGGKALTDLAGIAGMSAKSFQDLAKNDVASAINKIIGGLSEIQKQNPADYTDVLKMFELDAVQSQKAINTLSAKYVELGERRKQAYDVTGNTAKFENENKTQVERFSSALQLMKNNVAQFKASIGADLADGLLPLVNGITHAAQAFNEFYNGLPDGAQKVVAWGTTGVIAVTAVAMAVGKLGVAYRFVTMMMRLGSGTQAAAGIAEIGTQAAGSAGLVARLGGALGLLTNPVGLAVAAIAATGIAMYAMRNNLVETSDGVVTAGEVWSAEFEIMKENAAIAWNAVAETVLNIGGQIQTNASETWRLLKEDAQIAWDEVGGTVEDACNRMISSSTTLNAMVGIMQGVWGLIQNNAASAWDSIGATVQQGVLNTMSNLPFGIGMFASGVAGAVGLAQAGQKRAVKEKNFNAAEARINGGLSASMADMAAAYAPKKKPPQTGLGNVVIPHAEGKGGKKGGGKGKGGGGGSAKETDEQREAKEQARDLASWNLEAAKAKDIAEAFRSGTFGTPGNDALGLSPALLAEEKAILDETYKLRERASKAAVDNGKALTEDQLRQIKLTEAQIAAIRNKERAEKKARDAEDANQSIEDMNTEITQNEALIAIYNGDMSRMREELAVQEAIAAAKSRGRLATADEIATARTKSQTGVNLNQAKADSDARRDMEVNSEFSSRRAKIGFGDTRSQQVEVALLEKEMDLKRQGLSMSPAIAAAVRQETENTYDLAAAQQAYNERKEFMLGVFDAVSGSFKDLILGAKTFKQAISGLLSTLADLVIQYGVIIPLKRAFEQSSGGGGGGPGGFLGGLLKVIGIGASALGGSMGGGAAGGMSIRGPTPGFTPLNFSSGIKFADGGIMTSMGKVPLRKYSEGGIANSPQLAMFGEGSTAEAFVPVPSGKIPVEMRGSVGGKGGATHFAPSISVTVQNREGDDAGETGRRISDQIEAKMYAFMKREMRGGGMLYRGSKM